MEFNLQSEKNASSFLFNKFIKNHYYYWNVAINASERGKSKKILHQYVNEHISSI